MVNNHCFFYGLCVSVKRHDIGFFIVKFVLQDNKFYHCEIIIN